jgi:C1A family cysteine protease
MKAVFAIAMACALGAAVAHPTFEEFESTYSKTYANEEARQVAKAAFAENLAVIDGLNQEHVSIGGEEIYAVTKFTDMTQDDFAAFYLGLELGELPEAPVHEVNVRGNAPKTMDWRTKGVVSAVKNQEQCGSCWAFSTTESIESANAVAGNKLDDLTVEQIVDCSTQNDGCQGGNPTTAFQYVISAGGLESEQAYPYTAGGGQAGQCSFDKSKVEESIRGWSYATQTKSETAMVDAMAKNGPLSVCVDAQSWQFYSGGIMKAAGCGTQLDHAVQAVGYDLNQNYWIVRNSWGASWGEQGYIRLEYGANACGVAQLTTYATA